MAFRYLVIFIYLVAVSFFVGFIHIWHYFWDFFCFGESDDSLSYDYIIVGCGSAGALIAQRLSADKNVKVLVLEAGRDVVDLLHIPSIGLMLQQSPCDWQYSTVPQKNACFGLNNNASVWPMGKIVGGTGMLNNMLHVRGHREDFDEWFGSISGYNFEQDILPYFRKIEARSDSDDLMSSETAHISDPNFLTFLPEYMIKGAASLGLVELNDTANANIGMGIPRVYLHKGQRWTSASKLKLMSRHNLILKTNRLVEKVLFKDDFEATGVQYRHCQKSYKARAKKGVILSAGVIGSAKILMLSGIGRKDHLFKMGIRNKIDLPVGDNLQDHVTTGLDLVLLNTSLNLHIEDILLPMSAFNYFAKGSGPWTTAGCELLIYSKEKLSQNFKNTRPDLQFMVMPLAISEDYGFFLRKLMGISDKTWAKYFSFTTTQAITILPVLLHPKSKGTVRLAGNDIFLKPLIDPQYLMEEEDVNTLVAGIQIIKKLVQTESMQKLGARLNDNIFPGCEIFKFDTKEYWECYIRHLTITSYHPVGTCKLGQENDPSAVVNFNFQVKNTNNLYVVDGSVLPTLTSGNINAAILLLAEMASDKIKQAYFLQTKRCHFMEIFVIKAIC